MIFFKYRQPKAEYVQFQRLVHGLLLLNAVLFQMPDFVYAFFILSAVSFVTTINYSPTTLLFKLIHFTFGTPLFTTAPQYAHSYITYRLAEIFEDLIRISGGAAILYLYSFVPLAAWMLAAFMSIAMLQRPLPVSSGAFFGSLKALQSLIQVFLWHLTLR